MSRNVISLTLCLVLFVICMCDAILSDTHSLSRQKRGFRGDAASRVAHGFGKRGYFNPSADRLLRTSVAQVEDLPSIPEDFNDGTIMSVEDFAQLLASHPNLAQALLKKFVDIDDDGMISTEELFRPAMRK